MTATMQVPSPLSQVRRPTGNIVFGSANQLSLADQTLVRQVLAGKCDCMPNKIFTAPDAPKQIFDDAPPIAKPDTSWYSPVMDRLGDASTFTNLAEPVLLTAAQERVLFLQFNYCRYRIGQIKKKIGEKPVGLTDARELMEWNRKAQAYREQIANTNLALVLAMFKRLRLSDADFCEMVSEGNMALLRAIDKFDCARGFKFSTYACRAILKAFSRTGMKLTRIRSQFPASYDPKLEKSDFSETRHAEAEADAVDELRRIIRENRAGLTEIEQEVIEQRFAVGKQRQVDPETKPLTLNQVGALIGVTKERVRQIQNKAMEKIRSLLDEKVLT